MSLYNCMGGTETAIPAYYLGTWNNGTTKNIASKYADYANLTANNFIAVPQSNSKSASASGAFFVYWYDNWYQFVDDTNTVSYSQPSITYDASNGNLTVSSSLSVSGTASNRGTDIGLTTIGANGSVGLTSKVYLLPEIENL